MTRSLELVRRAALPAILVATGAACTPGRPVGADAGDGGEVVAIPPAPSTSAEPPSAPTASASAPEPVASAPPPPQKELHCPRGMLRVAGRFCVDKWEMSLVDKLTGTSLSPYYPPDRRFAIKLAESWERDRATMGDATARETPLPELPLWQRTNDPEPMAVSRPGVVPNGYLSGVMVARACENASKRLCRLDEWRLACEGEAKRPFPYGDAYVKGACNIFRDVHPGAALHQNASLGGLDPRMNLVVDKDGDPLLHLTGATERCKSAWGTDAAFDMNGNIDEWVLDNERGPDPETGEWRGRMAGGFFARAKRDGCASSVIVHPKNYLDYSIGGRCCWSPTNELEREDGNTGTRDY
jgi:formylglycine-generating enzyme